MTLNFHNLVAQLRQSGLETIHTLDLPDGNRTIDGTISKLSIQEQFVVVTKGLGLRGIVCFAERELWKLLLVSTGNIKNEELDKLFAASIERMVQGLDVFDFIELTPTSLIFHL